MKKLLLAIMTMMTLATTAQAAEQVVLLTPNNLLTLREEVSDESVSVIIMQLMLMPDKEVTLYINSPGGSISSGIDLANAIKASGKKVTCVASFAASMAFSILQACTVRYVTPGAIIMQHQASYGVKGSVSQVKTQVELVDKLVAKLNADDANRLGMPIKEFQSRIKGEWWLFDKEATQYKAADSIVVARCSPALAAKKVVQVIDSLFGSATLVWSACPLVTYPLSVEIKRKRDASIREFNEWAKELSLDQDWKTRKEVRN